MGFSIDNREHDNLGSVNVTFLEISNSGGYNGTGTTGEDMSASALEIPADPIHLQATPDSKNIQGRWDKSNNRLKMFYPTGAHSHKAFTVNASESGSDKTTFVSITEGDGTDQSNIAVSDSGSESSDIDITTDSVGGDSTDGPGAELSDSDDIGTWHLMVVYHGS